VTWSRIKLFVVRALWGFLLGLWPLTSGAYDGPVIDAHLHLFATTDPQPIRERFAAANVRRAVMLPREFSAGGDAGVSDEQATRFAAANADLAWVLIGLQRIRLFHLKPVEYWQKPDSAWRAWLKWAEGELASGRRKGMGELIVRHYDYHGKGNGEVDFPIRSRVFEDLLGVSNKTGRPLTIHAEGEAHVVKNLIGLLPQYPRAKLVWAHGCGRSNPGLVPGWLAAHPNLYCDLANMTDTGHYGSLWPRAGEWTFQVERNGVIEPEWLNVIHSFPRRLMIGSDVNETKGWPQAWDRRMARFRRLLDQVEPDAREWLAYRTAEALYDR
jgi:hypothetical protein